LEGLRRFFEQLGYLIWRVWAIFLKNLVASLGGFGLAAIDNVCVEQMIDKVKIVAKTINYHLTNTM